MVRAGTLALPLRCLTPEGIAIVEGKGMIAFVGAQFIAPFRKPMAGKPGVMNQGVMNVAPTEINGTRQGEETSPLQITCS